MPENPAKFEYQVLGDNEEPIVISDKDKEMPANVLFVAQKYDFCRENSVIRISES